MKVNSILFTYKQSFITRIVFHFLNKLSSVAVGRTQTLLLLSRTSIRCNPSITDTVEPRKLAVMKMSNTLLSPLSTLGLGQNRSLIGVSVNRGIQFCLGTFHIQCFFSCRKAIFCSCLSDEKVPFVIPVLSSWRERCLA